MPHEHMFGTVKGHVKIVDDLGNVLVNKHNAIHPQNMARIFARALANESNSSIYRIAYGNGGTTTDAAYTVTYNLPNDGQPPDTRTWDSRLYNETYSEIIDEGNVVANTMLGTDPGSADTNVGTRPGGGSVPASDPTSDLHTSGPGVRSVEEGVSSQVIITSVLNPQEPSGQTSGLSPDSTFSTSFAFDELGLYTSGASASASAGIAEINIGNKTSEVDTTLVHGTTYTFNIQVDGGSTVPISFTPPVPVGTPPYPPILYGEMCEAINTGNTAWNPLWANLNPLPNNATVAITDNTVNYPTITGAQTFGRLQFVSQTIGDGSSVVVTDGVTNGLFESLGMVGDPTSIPGTNAGVQNDPQNPETERERLLTHLIFSPVLKAEGRTLTVTYTLTITFTRTPQSF